MKFLDNLEQNFLNNKQLDKEIIIIDEKLKMLFGNLFYGKIIEIFGEEASGKTTFLYYLLSKLNLSTLLIDTEYQFSFKYANKIFNFSDILIYQENDSNKIEKIIKSIIENNLLNIICIDSFTGLKFNNFKETELFFKKLFKLIENKKIIILITNQMRDNPYTKKVISFGNNKIKRLYWMRLRTEKFKYNEKNLIKITNITESIKNREITLEY